MHRVTITGASGLVGRVLANRLGDRFVIEGIDRNAPHGSGIRRVDMTSPKRIDSLFEGADAVIDLAALPEPTRGWNDVWRNNLPATMNALEAARRAGVERFVFASSSRVTGLYEREHPYAALVAGEYEGLDPGAIPAIDPSWPIRPDSFYAVGKALGEAAARHYSDVFGLSAICLRLGTVNPENRPLQPRHFSTLLTHSDLARLVEAAVTAPSTLRYGVYYGVSLNRWRFWDLRRGRAEIGYEPQEDAEDWRQRAD